MATRIMTHLSIISIVHFGNRDALNVAATESITLLQSNMYCYWSEIISCTFDNLKFEDTNYELLLPAFSSNNSCVGHKNIFVTVKSFLVIICRYPVACEVMF